LNILAGQESIRAGQHGTLAVQENILAGQESILTGQKCILAVQDSILAVQESILTGQDNILADQERRRGEQTPPQPLAHGSECVTVAENKHRRLEQPTVVEGARATGTMLRVCNCGQKQAQEARATDRRRRRQGHWYKAQSV